MRGIGHHPDKPFRGVTKFVREMGRSIRRSTRRSAAAAPLVVTFPRPSADSSDIAVMARAEATLRTAIELGRAARFTVVPEFLSISATDNCNLRCVMCPGHSGMAGPKLTLEQADNLFAALGSNHADFGSPKFLDMTAGEPMLNTQLHLIFKLFKTTVLNGKISTISNATLPIKGRVKEAFALCDRIGLSIDGATKETYERIRKGSKFENVVRNIRDVAALKASQGGCDALAIMFVAMDQNAHELPALVRLAAELGIPEVFAQAVEHRSTPFLDGENIDFNMPPGELRSYLDEAGAEAKRLGVIFNPTNGLVSLSTEMAAPSASPPASSSALPDRKREFEASVRLCQVPWVNSPRFNLEKDDVRLATVCCHMPETEKGGSLRHHRELRGASVNTVFNSAPYWDVRSGLLDGSLAKGACKGCQYYESTQWTANQLRELEAAVARAANVAD